MGAEVLLIDIDSGQARESLHKFGAGTGNKKVKGIEGSEWASKECWRFIGWRTYLGSWLLASKFGLWLSRESLPKYKTQDYVLKSTYLLFFCHHAY